MKKLFYILLVFPMLAFAQTVEMNYLKTTVYKDSTTVSISDPEPEEATVSITYFDGLGRPLQQRGYKQSAGDRDIV